MRGGLAELEALFRGHVLPFRPECDDGCFLPMHRETRGFARKDFSIAGELVVLLLSNTRH
jgi:hypothetical protein